MELQFPSRWSWSLVDGDPCLSLLPTFGGTRCDAARDREMTSAAQQERPRNCTCSPEHRPRALGPEEGSVNSDGGREGWWRGERGSQGCPSTWQSNKRRRSSKPWLGNREAPERPSLTGRQALDRAAGAAEHATVHSYFGVGDMCVPANWKL